MTYPSVRPDNPPDDAGPGRRGLLVALEGGEAAGKTTQARLLAEKIGAAATFEPGATEAGKLIRALVLDSDGPPLCARAEALLMAADRAQHAAEVLRPNLEAGRHVVTDRYVGSTIAYQGHGRGLPAGELGALSAFATGGIAAGSIDADLVILLEVPAETAAARRPERADRFEAAGDEFHQRVAAGFLAQVRASPRTWASVDGTGTIADVADAVHSTVRERLGI